MTLLLLATIAVFGYACFNEGRKEQTNLTQKNARLTR